MTKSIRDYIYLDTGRVGSLYAQASGGLVESFVNTKHEHQSMQDTQKGLPLSGSEITKELLIGSNKAEKRVLHDYLFNELESLLSDKIVDVKSDDDLKLIKPGQLVRVNGIAELDDSQRLQALMENYDEFYRAISFAPFGDAIQKQVWELETQLQSNSNQQKRKLIQQQLDSLSLESLGRKHGLGVSSITVRALSLYFRLLYNDIFEVKIISSISDDYIFRAILNREYLRESSAVTYAKYGSRTQVAWTLVGQVTTIHSPKKVGENSELTPKIADELRHQGINIEGNFDSQSESTEIPRPENEESDVNIRDAIEGLYNAVSKIEEVFAPSRKRTVSVTTPFAIYYEIH